MEEKEKTTIHEAFAGLEDPRQVGKIEHPLINIIFLTICGVLCGADGWTEIESFGQAQREWLEQFLDLSSGIPAHDTFGRVFGQLKAAEFSGCFLLWMKHVAQHEGKQIAIDGKVMCGSQDNAVGREAIDMVTAFGVESGLSLAQQKVSEKSNEITAIPLLLEMLVLQDCVVTIDAMGCQRKIASQIVAQGGDYLLALKGNQGQLYEDVAEMFAYFEKIEFAQVKHSYHRQISKGHGRLEIRECWAFSPDEYEPYFRTLEKWAGLASVVMVRSERQVADNVERAVRFFISSLQQGAQEQLSYIRGHWGIENQLHWVLDVAFREDHHRARQGDSPANLAVIRQLVLNLLRQDNSVKGGIRTKRLRCGWDVNYRMKILRQLFDLA